MSSQTHEVTTCFVFLKTKPKKSCLSEMGANNSTRRVSLERDENDNVTVVKGIRLSEGVINRMRESSGIQQTTPPPGPAPATSTPPPAEPVASPPTVDETELRRKISEELQRHLEEERSRNRRELHQWLEKERTQLQAQAHADAQVQGKDWVSRVLPRERAALDDSIHYAALRERINADNEKLRVQSMQLEARDRALRKQEAFYREQVAKLEEQSAQVAKVTNENYHKAMDEVNAKFKRYEVSAVCADLQDQIMKCYRENVGKTLLCSRLASLYLQCVSDAKQANSER
ncbi:coiled-coil-helix-coiled-coil-helix domain containing 3a isoform X2 [Electrophorus electricus]|uniref:coiled-coil-helix-coiled-coil-helix domain containing 3a isoform X2 n=1 Tax=Electrophorus electricus TaxID=8005 RepID=UPI000F0A4F7B|nr:coiled-coil-helix-coiled-coil-helix domain containing 3a isoform X2 [Electrophorus electricus]